MVAKYHCALMASHIIDPLSERIESIGIVRNTEHSGNYIIQTATTKKSGLKSFAHKNVEINWSFFFFSGVVQEH